MIFIVGVDGKVKKAYISNSVIDLTNIGTVAWGEITGTLSNQADLSNALSAKEPTITGGTTAQYWRGDKTFQTLDKSAVGLSNVNNTSDINKPVSTAQATADTAVYNAAIAYSNGLVYFLPLFDHYTNAGNVTTGETDLYSDTIAANQLASNGQEISAEYGGVYVSSGTATRQIKIYFGGTVIFDTGALTLSLSAAWTAYVSIIRVSASIVRHMISFTTEGAALAAYTAVGEVTGLTLTNTNILKITGQAAGIGAATNDIVARMGKASWIKNA